MVAKAVLLPSLRVLPAELTRRIARGEVVVLEDLPDLESASWVARTTIMKRSVASPSLALTAARPPVG
jgi:hypothetical protein